MAGIYVKNADLYRELVISLEEGKLTDLAFEYSQRIAKEIITKKFRYKNIDDRNDCFQGAIMDVWAYWKSFKPIINGKKTNAFAYITQISKNGAAKAYNKIHPEKTRQDISIENIHTF